MRIRYFSSTDTLLIEFRDAAVAETRDLDENTVLDLDSAGHLRDHGRARLYASRHPALFVRAGCGLKFMAKIHG